MARRKPAIRARSGAFAGLPAWLAAMFAAMFAVVLAAPAWAQDCAENRLDIRGAFGTARFTVEIADQPAEQTRGLMFREKLASSAGMLFVYPAPGAPTFWMKNTLIPLDMLFITPDGTIASVHPEAVPGDLTGISGGSGILAVLEIRGGLAQALGIEPGDAVRHPAFDGPGAAWSCAAPGATEGAAEGAAAGAAAAGH